MLAAAGWPGAVMLPLALWASLKGQEAKLQYLQQILKL
jgi:hypothetical protein